MNQKTIFTELMRKLFTTVLMIPAFVAVTAQTEKTRGFDDLYHFIENLDVFEYGQEEAMPTHRRRYQATSSKRFSPTRSGAPLMCRQTGR